MNFKNMLYKNFVISFPYSVSSLIDKSSIFFLRIFLFLEFILIIRELDFMAMIFAFFFFYMEKKSKHILYSVSSTFFYSLLFFLYSLILKIFIKLYFFIYINQITNSALNINISDFYIFITEMPFFNILSTLKLLFIFYLLMQFYLIHKSQSLKLPISHKFNVYIFSRFKNNINL